MQINSRPCGFLWFLFLSCWWTAGWAYAGEAPDTRIILDEAGVELYAPAFNRSGDSIALVRKIHEPDGHEGELLSEEMRAGYKRRKNNNRRWADPEVIVVSLTGEGTKTVDYGWEPEFMPGTGVLFYSHQEKPISGLRVLAETQKGNQIFSFDIRTGDKRRLVSPETGYLDQPLPSPDGNRLAYAICDAVNGAWGGQVGAGLYDLEKGQAKTVLPPEKHHGLYDLVGPMIWSGDRLLVLRRQAEGGGKFLADSYKFELLDLTDGLKIIYTTGWSVHEGQKNPVLEESEPGSVSIGDGRTWKKIDLKSGKVVETRPVPEEAEEQKLNSSDGKYACKYEDEKFVVENLKTGKSITARLPAKIIQSCWSPDSRRLAFVVSEDKRVFDRDRLLLITLPENF